MASQINQEKLHEENKYQSLLVSALLSNSEHHQNDRYNDLPHWEFLSQPLRKRSFAEKKNVC